MLAHRNISLIQAVLQAERTTQGVQKHKDLLQQYHTAQAMHQDHPAFQTAVDDYNASRNLDQDSTELKSRDTSRALQQMKNSREKAERVITQMMAPRPSAPPDVFYLDEKHSTYATITYQQFDDYLEPNGYDLPEDSKLVTLQVVTEEDDLMIINKSGTVIRLHVDDIKETKNRATQGTKVIELKKRGDSIAHVCVVPRSEEEEETSEEAVETQAEAPVEESESKSQNEVQGEFDFDNTNE
jgi:DNA gyrase/topoisomerase IV subunit A